MSITIYHNPKCGTSRNTLGLIRNTGVEPAIIEYLNNPPSRPALAVIVKLVVARWNGFMQPAFPPQDGP
ncbi:MAG TPA: hypothetical protein VIP51_14880, partial [Eoetvoesiella sp.]